MQRPPRHPEHQLLSRSLLASAVGHAALITVATFAAYALAVNLGTAPTVAFLTLATAQVLHLGNARSSLPTVHPRRLLANRAALAGAAVSLVLVAATSQVSSLARLLSLTPIGTPEWAIVLACGAAPAVAGQAWRAWRARSRLGHA